jgi:ABC-type uncharacterized transport system involved in gliding motility auxiliary subunit
VSHGRWGLAALSLVVLACAGGAKNPPAPLVPVRPGAPAPAPVPAPDPAAAGGRPRLAFTVGHGEHHPADGLYGLSYLLTPNYDVTTVNPSTTAIDPRLDVLIVGGPTQPFDEIARRRIDAFLRAGKGAVLLQDGMILQVVSSGPTADSTPDPVLVDNVDAAVLPAAYGIRIGRDVILDQQSAPSALLLEGRKMLITLPVFVAARITPVEGLPIAAGEEKVLFSYVSSVEVTAPTGARVRTWQLAASSAASWRQHHYLHTEPDPAQKEKGPFPLAIAAEIAPTAAAPPARLLVVGDSDFVSDDFLQLGKYLPSHLTGVRWLAGVIDWVARRPH